MKINKIFITSAIVLATAVVAVLVINLLRREVNVTDRSGDSIQYIIEPIGKSECKNLGAVDLNGAKADLAALKSKILFVEVTEKVFYNPQDSLPYRTERANSGLWINEYRTEEYDQKKFTVTVQKFNGKKLVKEQILQADGPIQNMNTLLFLLRKEPDLKIGWHLKAKVVDELKLVDFDLKLLSIDDITVPGGKFQAYHFKSVPDTFEIWIDNSARRIPLKIIIKGVINCSLLMKGYNTQNHE